MPEVPAGGSAASSPESLSDHDMLHEQQSRLLLLCRRSMALPVGRGMFTLGLATPLPTEALDIPPLQLGGRLPQNDALIKLDLATPKSCIAFK